MRSRSTPAASPSTTSTRTTHRPASTPSAGPRDRARAPLDGLAGGAAERRRGHPSDPRHGPAAKILVDANDGFTLDDARAYLDAVADCGLHRIEEPFTERPDDLAEPRGTIRSLTPGTPIADGESRPDVPQMRSFAADGLLDVAPMEVVDFGITAWRRTMPTVVASGTPASPHAWGEPIRTYYAAQVAAVLGNVPIIEGVPGTTDGVDDSAYRFACGILRLPEAPGFGLELTG